MVHLQRIGQLTSGDCHPAVLYWIVSVGRPQMPLRQISRSMQCHARRPNAIPVEQLRRYCTRLV